MDRPLSSAGVVEESKRECIATTVTDSGSILHHPRPWPGVSVGVEGLVGFYDVPRDTSGDDPPRVKSGNNVPPPSDEDGGRPGAGPDTQTEPETKTRTETERSSDTASSQISPDGGDEPSMVDLLPSHPPAHPVISAEAWGLEDVELLGREGEEDSCEGRWC